MRAGFGELAVLVEAGPAKGDVVGLPLSGRARGVGERRILAVNGPGLAVGVGIGLVGIEDLQLEQAHEENAAVAAILALAAGRVGRGPLDMQLNIPEFGLGLDRSGSRGDFHEPVRHLPPCRAALGGLPGVEVRSIEQDDGILRRRAAAECSPGSTTGGLGRRMSCCNQRFCVAMLRTSSAARKAKSPAVAIRPKHASRKNLAGMGVNLLEGDGSNKKATGCQAHCRPWSIRSIGRAEKRAGAGRTLIRALPARLESLTNPDEDATFNIRSTQ